jgi:MFS family permease
VRQQLRSFEYRNFRLFFMANSVTNVGTWAQRVAQDWLVLELTHSGTMLGFVTGVQFLPSLLFGMWGGKLADRFDKRKTLSLTNGLGGFSALLLGALILLHVVELWHVFILAFLAGTAAAFDAPVRQSFVTELVGKSNLQNAISLNSTNFNIGRLIGPALSGLLINLFGTGPSFIINGISFLLVILALWLMNSDEFEAEEFEKSVDAKIREAFGYVRSHRDILHIMIVVGAMAFFGLNFQVTTALMAKVEFQRGAGSFGLLGTCVAIGSVAGAIFSTRIERSPEIKRIIVSAIFFGLACMLASVMPSYEWFALTLPLCGGTALVTLIAANTWVQSHTEPHIRGRVMGIYITLLIGSSPIGSPLVGTVAEHLGPRWAIAIGGFGALFFALLVALRRKINERVH